MQILGSIQTLQVLMYVLHTFEAQQDTLSASTDNDIVVSIASMDNDATQVANEAENSVGNAETVCLESTDLVNGSF